MVSKFPELQIQTIDWIQRKKVKVIWNRKVTLLDIKYTIKDWTITDWWSIPFFLWWWIHPFYYPYVKCFVKHDADCSKVHWVIIGRFIRLWADSMLAISLYEVRRIQIAEYWNSWISILNIFLIYYWVRIWAVFGLLRAIYRYWRKKFKKILLNSKK